MSDPVGVPVRDLAPSAASAPVSWSQVRGRRVLPWLPVVQGVRPAVTCFRRASRARASGPEDARIVADLLSRRYLGRHGRSLERGRERIP